MRRIFCERRCIRYCKEYWVGEWVGYLANDSPGRNRFGGTPTCFRTSLWNPADYIKEFLCNRISATVHFVHRVFMVVLVYDMDSRIRPEQTRVLMLSICVTSAVVGVYSLPATRWANQWCSSYSEDRYCTCPRLFPQLFFMLSLCVHWT